MGVVVKESQEASTEFTATVDLTASGVCIPEKAQIRSAGDAGDNTFIPALADQFS